MWLNIRESFYYSWDTLAPERLFPEIFLREDKSLENMEVIAKDSFVEESPQIIPKAQKLTN